MMAWHVQGHGVVLTRFVVRYLARQGVVLGWIDHCRRIDRLQRPLAVWIEQSVVPATFISTLHLTMGQPAHSSLATDRPDQHLLPHLLISDWPQDTEPGCLLLGPASWDGLYYHSSVTVLCCRNIWTIIIVYQPGLSKHMKILLLIVV